MTDPGTLPPADTIRQTAIEVLEREVFQHSALRLEMEGELRLGLSGYLEQAVAWFRPLWDAVAYVFSFSHILGYALLLVVALVVLVLLVRIGFALIRLLWAPRTRGVRGAPFRLPSSLDPRDWEARALQAVDAGDRIRALRCLLRAGILRLQEVSGWRYRPGLTNREIRFRFRSTPVAAPLGVLVRLLDAKWYGGQTCTADEYSEGAHAYQTLCAEVRRLRTHASKP